MEKKLIEEINILAKKQREQGLTETEKKRQAQLRKVYIDNVRRNFKQQLDELVRASGDKNDQ